LFCSNERRFLGERERLFAAVVAPNGLKLRPRDRTIFALGRTAIVLALGCLASPIVATPTAWQLIDDGDPSPGNWPMVFDTVRQRAVLETGGSLTVGGVDGPAIHWELVGSDWVRIWTPEPTPKQRTEVCATFDSARGVMVMFGAGPNYNETWEF